MVLLAMNDAPTAQYVYGPYQQPFLDKWPDAETVLLDIGAQLDTQLEGLWDEIVEGL